MYHNDALNTVQMSRLAGGFTKNTVSGEAEIITEAVEKVGFAVFEGYDRAKNDPGIET